MLLTLSDAIQIFQISNNVGQNKENASYSSKFCLTRMFTYVEDTDTLLSQQLLDGQDEGPALDHYLCNQLKSILGPK